MYRTLHGQFYLKRHKTKFIRQYIFAFFWFALGNIFWSETKFDHHLKHNKYVIHHSWVEIEENFCVCRKIWHCLLFERVVLNVLIIFCGVDDVNELLFHAIFTIVVSTQILTLIIFLIFSKKFNAIIVSFLVFYSPVFTVIVLSELMAWICSFLSTTSEMARLAKVMDKMFSRNSALPVSSRTWQGIGTDCVRQ